jgi:arylsulfatase A-like enzyme
MPLMPWPRFIQSLVSLLLPVVIACSSAVGTIHGQPNFIIILADDLGYGDLGCFGSTDTATPNVDRLAVGGARLTNFYANAAVCSPSRAALLTGRYPGKSGVRCNLGRLRDSQGLWPEVPTVAKALKDVGYRTAMAGKWHLGCVEESRPDHQGFDRWFGCLSGAVDYFSHLTYSGQPDKPGTQVTHDLHEDNRDVWENGRYMTELITERTVRYVREFSKGQQPFFLYVSYTAVHYPMHAPQKYLDRFAQLPPDRRITAAMLSALDDGVGEIVAELDKQGVRNNTCVLFMSDNGPSREYRNWLDGRPEAFYGGSAGKLRGHKLSLFDGGIRVPAIMNWPGRIPAGAVRNEMAAAMDIFPTFLRAAGGDSSKYALDGLDILPLITEGKPTPHREIFWERTAQTAVRRGKWKLVLNGELEEGRPPEDDVHLSDLDSDMGERVNLKGQYPELTQELTAAALAWRANIDKRWSEQWKPRIHDPFILGKPINLDESQPVTRPIKP